MIEEVDSSRPQQTKIDSVHTNSFNLVSGESVSALKVKDVCWKIQQPL